MLSAAQAPARWAERLAIAWPAASPAASPATAPARTSAAHVRTRGARAPAQRLLTSQPSPGPDAVRWKAGDAGEEEDMGAWIMRVPVGATWPAFYEARM